MKAWLQRHLLFVLVVLIPTAGAVLHYGLIASDVYISESRFIVRSPQHQAPSGLVGQLLQSSGISPHSQDDTYSVRDYILSRDALRELDSELDLRKAFSGANVDILDRFPGLAWNKSFERFYVYYGKHIAVEYDPVSSISILTARAFTANDAYKINRLLLDMSERLVNTLNDRSRSDLIKFADNEVQIASDKVKDASLALLDYRSNKAVFEPTKQAALQLEAVARIQQELITTENRTGATQKALAGQSPDWSAKRVGRPLCETRSHPRLPKVTSANGSLSARAPAFERLTLDVEFADKQLGAALAGLESARAEALQKQLYLETVVQPNLPDKAMEPKRIRSIFTVFIFSLFGWAIVSILIASVREHAD